MAPGGKNQTFHTQIWRYLYDEEEYCEGYAEYRRDVRLHRQPVITKQLALNFGGNTIMKMMKNLTKSMQSIGEMNAHIGC